MKKFRATMLFLVLLCTLSAGIVYFRNDYITKMNYELKEEADRVFQIKDEEQSLNVFEKENKEYSLVNVDNINSKDDFFGIKRNNWCYRNSKY